MRGVRPPLVDPGFSGKLSLPLHNLTANTYTIFGGEPLVWMEFTKLSPSQPWLRPPRRQPDRRGVYVPFPSRKLSRQTVRDYVNLANQGRPIRSSIPELVQSSAEAAEEARKDSEDARRFSRNLSLAGVVAVAAIVITVIGLYLNTANFLNEARSANDATTQRVERLEAELNRLRSSGVRR